jgi:APA family basic amino acid/polyamine antiporter
MRSGLDSPTDAGHLKRQLTLFDTVMVVVGGTIGSSIFIVPADVIRSVKNPLIALLLWAFTGVITLMTGVSCAELGGMFPEAGGQYVYIREAYGGFFSFLYGWAQFTVGNSAALAAMGISFAFFIGRAFSALSSEYIVYEATILGMHWELTRGALLAIVSMLILTAVNVRSLKMAAWLQNITAFLLLGMVVGIAGLGLLFGHGSWSHFSIHAGGHAELPSFAGLGAALIALMWANDGWEYAAWVGGEIANARRNLPLALLYGILLVTATFLLANVLFLYALPAEQLAQQTVVADVAMEAMFSHNVGRWVSLFIATVSLGGCSVAVLGGARVYFSMARAGAFLRGMGLVHPRFHTPSVSLVVQCLWVILLIASGRYEQLYTCFVFVLTLTSMLTLGAVFILRRTRPDSNRPYRCPAYPWLPAAAFLIAMGLAISTVYARPKESLTGLGLTLLGIPLYLYWRRTD